MTTTPNACCDAALDYAQRGWPVLPLHSVRDGRCTCGDSECGSPGKHPRNVNGLTGATTDPETIRQWWAMWPDANVAVATGEKAGIFALDVDLEYGGDKSLAELEAQHGALPATPRQRTGGGGEHILFKYPGFKVGNRNEKNALAPGIHVRGDGGYIVGAPSNHISGGVYDFGISGDPATVPLADAPPWLLARLNGHKATPAEADYETAEREAIQREAAGAPMPKGERNGDLASLAGAMRRKGATETEILAALRTANRERCKPPLPDGEVEKIARSVARYPAEEEGDGEAYPQFKPVRILLSDHPALHPPVIDGLLREGETLNLIAPSKFRKSWLVMHLACAVATGTDWIGFRTRQGRVLHIDNELHTATLAHRIPGVAEALGLGLSELADTLCVESLRGKLRDIFKLRSYFRVLSGFKLVILDSLYRFLPKEADENSNAGMAAVYNALDRYAADGGFAFVCIHHSSKGIQAGKAITDVGAGAGAMARATDAHVIMREHAEQDCVAVEAVTRSFPPPSAFCMRWTFPIWTLAPELDPANLRTSWGRRKPAAPDGDATPPAPAVTLDSFMAAVGTETPRLRDEILAVGTTLGLSLAQSRRWFDKAREAGRLHQWTYGATVKRKYATVAQNGGLA